MYEKFLSLLLKYRRSYKDYFILKSEEGTFFEPNYLSRLNKLNNLGEEFFEIYSKIRNKINFEYPKRNHVGALLRGNINWQKTITNSTTFIPIKFHSSIPYRKFDTPENLLLILCVYWINSESTILLNSKIEENVDETLKQINLDDCSIYDFLKE